MKKFSLIVCLIVFSFRASAQDRSIDSLKVILKTLPQDTFRINVLNNLSTSFIKVAHFDSAIRYVKAAIELSGKLNYTGGISLAYYNASKYYFHLEDYKPGKLFLLEALKSALMVSDKKSIANDYKDLTDLYQKQGNFKLAKECNAKFVLYEDSLTVKENAKRDDSIKISNESKEKQNDIRVNEATISALSESKMQQIFYISLAVLVLLSVLIIWLMINRSKKAKRTAALELENEEAEQLQVEENINKTKAIGAENILFLQKIAEKEASAFKTTVATNKPKKITEAIENDDKNIAQELKNTQITVGLKNNAPKIDDKKEELSLPDLKTSRIEEAVLSSQKDNIIASTLEATDQLIFDPQVSNLVSADRLLHFAAKPVRGKIKIVWETKNEDSIKCFNTEKSIDGKQFVGIQSIVPKGVANNYEIFDLQPLPGINYYRIEIIDDDGNFIFGPTVQVQALPAATLQLVCYPSHTKNLIMVTAAGGKLPVSVNIYDAAGKRQFNIEVPPTTTPIYLSDLAIGKYTLQMKCQGKTVFQQLVKIA